MGKDNEEEEEAEERGSLPGYIYVHDDYQTWAVRVGDYGEPLDELSHLPVPASTPYKSREASFQSGGR
jgi:hypothetical protein